MNINPPIRSTQPPQDQVGMTGKTAMSGRLDVRVIRAKGTPWYKRAWSFLFDRRSNL